jgi:hypothetical protein
MNTNYRRIESLFDAARGLTDPARQRAFLESACAGEVAVLAKIERLLRASECADEFLADCIPTLAAISAAFESGAIPPPAELGICEE